MNGATGCLAHGAGAGQVRAKADVRAELYAWGFTDQTVDPGETLLRLLTQSSMRCARYSAELETMVEETGLHEALISETWIPTEHGDTYKAGEQIRGLAKLEADERDRCANFATKAIAAGLAERQVRLAERQGEMLAAMVTAALSEVSMPADIEAQFKAALARQVRELTI